MVVSTDHHRRKAMAKAAALKFRTGQCLQAISAGDAYSIWSDYQMKEQRISAIITEHLLGEGKTTGRQLEQVIRESGGKLPITVVGGV